MRANGHLHVDLDDDLNLNVNPTIDVIDGGSITTRWRKCYALPGHSSWPLDGAVSALIGLPKVNLDGGVEVEVHVDVDDKVNAAYCTTADHKS